MPFLVQEGHVVSGPPLDLLDSQALANHLKEQAWDAVVHLAAVSHVPTSEKEPEKAYSTNVAGTGLLLELLRRHQPQAHLIFTSTAQVYEPPQEGVDSNLAIRIDESRRICPQNTYARTKRAGELLVDEFARNYGSKATILRLFNHTHRAQSPDFFLPYLYSVLKAAPRGKKIEVPVGNLNVLRDFGTIQDLLHAFSAVISHRLISKSGPAVEVFNVCSGIPKNLNTLAQGLAWSN